MSKNLINVSELSKKDILDLIELANNFKSEDCLDYRNENLFPVLRVKFGPLSDLEAPKSISRRNDWILLLLKKGHSSWL